jgi:hypothetical protein
MAVTEVRYGQSQVNHERVRRAMAEVGARLEAERRARVAAEQAEIVARGGHICEGRYRGCGGPCEHAACLLTPNGWRCVHHAFDDDTPARRPPHDYGPHRPEDAPTAIEVWIGRPSRPVLAAIHPDLLRQREQINTIAHAAVRRAAA